MFKKILSFLLCLFLFTSQVSARIHSIQSTNLSTKIQTIGGTNVVTSLGADELTLDKVPLFKERALEKRASARKQWDERESQYKVKTQDLVDQLFEIVESILEVYERDIDELYEEWFSAIDFHQGANSEDPHYYFLSKLSDKLNHHEFIFSPKFGDFNLILKELLSRTQTEKLLPIDFEFKILKKYLKVLLDTYEPNSFESSSKISDFKGVVNYTILSAFEIVGANLWGNPSYNLSRIQQLLDDLDLPFIKYAPNLIFLSVSGVVTETDVSAYFMYTDRLYLLDPYHFLLVSMLTIRTNGSHLMVYVHGYTSAISGNVARVRNEIDYYIFFELSTGLSLLAMDLIRYRLVGDVSAEEIIETMIFGDFVDHDFFFSGNNNPIRYDVLISDTIVGVSITQKMKLMYDFYKTRWLTKKYLADKLKESYLSDIQKTISNKKIFRTLYAMPHEAFEFLAILNYSQIVSKDIKTWFYFEDLFFPPSRNDTYDLYLKQLSAILNIPNFSSYYQKGSDRSTDIEKRLRDMLSYYLDDKLMSFHVFDIARKIEEATGQKVSDSINSNLMPLKSS